jgi:hypothetical protein
VALAKSSIRRGPLSVRQADGYAGTFPLTLTGLFQRLRLGKRYKNIQASRDH